MDTEQVLTHEEARSFYDRFGRLQDVQAFYEDPALRVLLDHARFEDARAVLEFGCGTGRLARDLLDRRLPRDARYLALDVSRTMARLARGRLAPYPDRAEVRLTDGSVRLEEPDGSFDRFLCVYVLDLLSREEGVALLAEARRVLAPDGLACLMSLTHGCSLASKALIGLWKRLHALSPKLVGGCRPIEVLDLLGGPEWEVLHREVVVSWSVPTEVVVARRR